MAMTDNIKDISASLLGAASSLLAYATGFLKTLTLSASVSILSPDFIITLITAFCVGIAGALGGLITRETYKFIMRCFFNQKSNPKEDEN